MKVGRDLDLKSVKLYALGSNEARMRRRIDGREF
jgi:hypothetical protein